MLDIMSQAANAIEAYTRAINTTASNITNLSTPGYKRLDVSFQSVFERVLSSGSAASDTMGGTNPRQLGQGMSISSMGIDFSPGDTSSGGPLDLAVSGSGFFIVSPDGGNSFLYSRSGNFKVDGSGNLTLNNMQVYGLDSAGNPAAITGLSGYDTSLLSWTSDGRLAQFTDTNYTSVSAYTPYTIALTYFSNPSGLVQSQGTTFTATAASGDPATPQGPYGLTGTISPRMLEQSNVNYLSETILAAELQRAVSANLSVVKMASDMISNFISKLG